MNIQAEKLKLIEWLISIQDQSIIEKLKFLMDNSPAAGDWWDALSESERASLEGGIKDSDEGRVTPHSEAQKKYGKWL